MTAGGDTQWDLIVDTCHNIAPPHHTRGGGEYLVSFYLKHKWACPFLLLLIYWRPWHAHANVSIEAIYAPAHDNNSVWTMDGSEMGELAVTSSVDCRYFLSLRQIIFWEHQTVELWMLWPTVCLTSILFLLIQDQVATYTCRGEEVQIKALKLHSEHQKRCSSVLLHKRSYIICGLKKWGDIRTLNLIFSQQIRITWGLRSKLRI